MPSKAGNKRRRIAVRLAIVIPLLLGIGFGAWYGANLLVARQLRLIDMVDIGDLDGVLYVCRWDPGQTDKIESVQLPRRMPRDPYGHGSVPSLWPIELSPLHLAARKGHCLIARELLSRGANPTGKLVTYDPDDERTEFTRDVSGRDWGAYVSHGATFESTLGVAVSCGDFALVKEMLEAGACVSFYGSGTKSPLERAIHQDRGELVELLLLAGAITQCYVTEDGRDITYDHTMLDVAIVSKKPRAAVTMRRLGVPSGDDRILLHYAALENWTDVAKVLAARGDALDQKDWMGRTPLAWSIIRGNTAVARVLLGAGAKLSMTEFRNPRNIGTLHYAVEEGHRGIVELLIQYGVDVNKTDELGNSPLRIAIDNHETAIAEVLVKAGAKAVPPERRAAADVPLCTYRAGLLRSNLKRLCPDGVLDSAKLAKEHSIVLPNKESGSKSYWAIARVDSLPYSREVVSDHLILRTSRKYAAALRALEQHEKAYLLDLEPLSGGVLHLAVYYDEPEVIEALVESGENINTRDILGYTPLDWAQTRNLRDLLRPKGAKTQTELGAGGKGNQ